MARFLSDAVLLAVIYVLSYFYVYCFEIGYAFRFGYPPNLLPVTLDNILHVWSLVILYLVLLFGYLQINMQYWPATQKHVVAFVLMTFLYMFLLITVVSFLGDWLTFGNFNINILLVICLSSIFAYVAVLVYNRNMRGNYNDKKEEGGEVEEIFTIFDARSVVPKDSMGYRMLKKFGFDPFLVGIVLLVEMPAISVYAGFGEAYSKRDFFIYQMKDEEKSYIILAIQSGIIVSALYDPQHESYNKKFFVREITDTNITGMARTTVNNLEVDAPGQTLAPPRSGAAQGSGAYQPPSP